MLLKYGQMYLFSLCLPDYSPAGRGLGSLIVASVCAVWFVRTVVRTALRQAG